ncbi:hypothetical protein NL503_28475, partial [Klebsiella pneumoniae]|nr:hypothetical protein [Klebsiella pneumoniae]
MFFGAERLVQMRRFILASSQEERIESLNEIRKYQIEDFEQIFRLSNGRPTIVRLLDPPLHEFLPKTNDEIQLVSQQLNVDK